MKNAETENGRPGPTPDGDFAVGHQIAGRGRNVDGMNRNLFGMKVVRMSGRMGATLNEKCKIKNEEWAGAGCGVAEPRLGKDARRRSLAKPGCASDWESGAVKPRQALSNPRIFSACRTGNRPRRTRLPQRRRGTEVAGRDRFIRRYPAKSDLIRPK